MKYKIGWILAALLLITLLGSHRIFLEGFHLPGTEPRNPTAVCLYAYYEKNEDYKKNLEFFLEHGILDDVDYYIIINGNSTVQIPDRSNIKVLQRENKGFDFGAWSYGLAKLDREYPYYIFVNSSVIGPYMTEEDRSQNRSWVQKFLVLFNKPDVKLVGSTINMVPDYTGKPLSHVQSMFFILDQEGLGFLKSQDFFNESKLNEITKIQEVIDTKEIGMSQMILKNNWNLNCIVPNYRDQDYRVLTENINEPKEVTDVVYKNAFFGRSLTPEEVVFYKKYRMDLDYCTIYF